MSTLSINANQRSLKELFKNDDTYIIPSYQRPYSWGYDQIIQLYEDITDAYNHQTDYFIGNIIVARSNADKDSPNVVDGQQRLLTLWLFIKVLSLLHPEMRNLYQLLSVEDLKGIERTPKINTLVFERNDGDVLKGIHETIELSLAQDHLSRVINSHGFINENLCHGALEYAWLLIVQIMSDFYSHLKNEEGEKFLDYFLNRVYLLPIEMSGHDIEEASEKALTIFETINNRGLSLEDADLFKARLYAKADSVHSSRVFINQWTDLVASCADLNLKIDEVFRYYSHIIRGENNIIENETNIRDFFIKNPISPLQNETFEQVMNNLTNVIRCIEETKHIACTEQMSADWIRILNAYSNIYPQYAIVTYLYKRCSKDDILFASFLRRLIQRCYPCGASSSSVKFEVYNIIQKVANDIDISKNGDLLYFDKSLVLNPRKLFTGLALLSFKLTHIDRSSLSYCQVIKKCNRKQAEELSKEWDDSELPGIRIYNSLANACIYDSRTGVVYEIFDSGRNIDSAEDFFNYEDDLTKLLLYFFNE